MSELDGYAKNAGDLYQVLPKLPGYSLYDFRCDRYMVMG